MATQTKSEARLNFRLPVELKYVIEEAAAALGQSVSAFAVSTLVQSAHSILHQRQVTRLTKRDRDMFLAMLDDTSARPNRALREAAQRYKKRLGKSA